MRNGQLSVALAAAFSLLLWGAEAARLCGNTTSYGWRISDVRFDTADPTKSGSWTGTVAVSINPNPGGAIFECVAEMPEPWGGYYKGGSQPVWSDCIWAGNAGGPDKTVAFAMDWKNWTMYLSHTFACSDRNGTDSFATGSANVDMNCTTADDGGKLCIPKSNGTRTAIPVTTKQGAARLTADSCAENEKSYQAWQLEEWTRNYDLPAGTSTPAADTGPSFTLRSVANSDVFNCVPSGQQNSSFIGTCTAKAAGNATSSAKFAFDPKLEMLQITQHWSCGGSSFDAVGVGYVQGNCARAGGDRFTCTSDPVWVGTKAA